MAKIDLNILILVVDDFPTMRKIVKTSLKQLGFANTFEAEDGLIAHNILKKQPIDLIISDWDMPNMTGIELLKIVRSDPKLKHIPFLMVTAEADKNNIIEAVNQGVNGFIVKPFTSSTMKEKLEKIFGRKIP